MHPLPGLAAHAQIAAAVLAAVLGAQPRAPAALSATFSSAVSPSATASAPGPGPNAGLAIGLGLAAATLLALAATVIYVRATGSCCGVHAVCVPLASSDAARGRCPRSERCCPPLERVGSSMPAPAPHPPCQEAPPFLQATGATLPLLLPPWGSRTP